jgi:transposase
MIDPQLHPFPSPATDTHAAVDGMEDDRVTDKDVAHLLKFIGATEGTNIARVPKKEASRTPESNAPSTVAASMPGPKHGADLPPAKSTNYHSVRVLSCFVSSMSLFGFLNLFLTTQPEAWLFGASQ